MAFPRLRRRSAHRAFARRAFLGAAFVAAGAVVAERPAAQPSTETGAEVHDAHLHLTNYVQEGTDIHDLLRLMGKKVGRATLFGIPLQQTWSYENTGDFAPTYYLQSDAPLYYYSFTDAFIASVYRSLSEEDQARFDPMITGFNPADMYAADHIRRVLTVFPGVFSGIGEFTIHKEFVSAKIAGDTPSLVDPAVDRIFDFAAEVGLVVLIHSDIDMPFPRPGQDPWPMKRLGALFRRHPKTTIIWAHIGLGRVVSPVQDQLAMLDRALSDPALRHVHVDISWDEVAKYLLATPETTAAAVDVINRHPDRFLFGSDEVAPTDEEGYLKTLRLYQPLFARLSVAASHKVRKGNYERIFDEARRRVRSWEKAQLANNRGRFDAK